MRHAPYRFRSAWRFDAPPDDVYAALERLTDYPRWWPQVRRVTQLSDTAAELTCQSTLPYALRFTTVQSVRDPVRRVLEAHMTGDLDGFARWSIGAEGTGTTATFDEEVVVTKRLLRWLDPVARPAFEANHSRMMRDGERGLRAHLAARRTA